MKKDLSLTCYETSKLVMLSFGANSFCEEYLSRLFIFFISMC